MTDESFAREVDEAVRQDQMKALWDRYGWVFLGGAVAIVGSVAGYKAWVYWRAQQAAESGSKFVGALLLEQEKKVDEAREAFEGLAADGPSGYRVLARFQLAAAMAKAGERAKALEAYRSLANDAGAGDLIKDYARIQIATLSADEDSLESIKSGLEPLLTPSNAWRFSARELLGITAYGKGNTKEARDQFEALISDVETPPGIKRRAEMILSLIVKADAGQSDK